MQPDPTPFHRAPDGTVTRAARRPWEGDGDEDLKATYDWLKANGVDEWLPEQPTITVDKAANTLTYDAFGWEGARGWDGGNIAVDNDGNVVTERRFVKLVQVPDANIIAAAERAGATITVVG